MWCLERAWFLETKKIASQHCWASDSEGRLCIRRRLVRLIMPSALWPELKSSLRSAGELFRRFRLSFFSN